MIWPELSRNEQRAYPQPPRREQQAIGQMQRCSMSVPFISAVASSLLGQSFASAVESEPRLDVRLRTNLLPMNGGDGTVPGRVRETQSVCLESTTDR